MSGTDRHDRPKRESRRVPRPEGDAEPKSGRLAKLTETGRVTRPIGEPRTGSGRMPVQGVEPPTGRVVPGTGRHQRRLAPPSRRGKFTGEVLAGLLEAQEVPDAPATWLHVSDGVSEKCVLFSPGGVRLASLGPRRARRLREAILGYPGVDRELLLKFPALDTRGLENAPSSLKKAVQACSLELIRDELLDLVVWDGAEFMLSEAAPPETLFTPRVEALTIPSKEPELLRDLRARMGEWAQMAGRMSPPSRRWMTLVARTNDTGPLPRALLQAIGRHGCSLESAILVGRQAGHDALRVCAGVDRLIGSGAVELDEAPYEPPSAREPRLRAEIRTIERDLDLQIDPLPAHRRLARCYEALGEPEQAVEWLRLMGEELERREEREEALAVYEQVLELTPNAFFARERIASLHEALGRLPEAIREWLKLARDYSRARLFTLAWQRLDRVVQLDPTSIPHRRLLADLLRAMGREDEAAAQDAEVTRLIQSGVAPPEGSVAPRAPTPVEPQARPVDPRAARSRDRTLLLAALLLAVAGAPVHYQRRQAVEELARVEAEALAAAGARRFADARAAIARYQEAHARAPARVGAVLEVVDQAEAGEAEREGAAAARLEAEGKLPEARERYQRMVATFRPELPGASIARTRLAAFEQLEAKAREEAAAAGRALASGSPAEALALGQKLLAERPWTQAARELVLPLEVDSVPPRAGVEVDGELVGMTPLVVTRPARQPFDLLVSLKGYVPHQARLEAVASTGGKLTITLEKAPRWVCATLGPLVRPPVARNTLVLVAGTDQRIYALGPGNGELRWVHVLPPFVDIGGDPVVCAPRVVVLVESGGDAVGLDLRNGQPRWRREVGAGLRTVGQEGALVVLAGPSQLLAIDWDDGSEAWRAPLPAALAATPVLDEGRVLTALEDGRLLVHDAATGRERQPARALGGVPASPPLVTPSGPVLLLDGGSRLRGVAEKPWTLELPGPATGEPCASGELVLVSVGSELLAVDALGGVAWRADLKARLGPPAASAQLVVVPAAGGVLHGLDASTGQPRWQLRPGGEIDAAPVVESKTVYAASRDGTLYAMPLD